MEQFKANLGKLGIGSRRVMLVSPGLNVPTIGCVFLLLVHAFVSLTGGTHLTPELLRPLYERVAVSWVGVSQGEVGALLTHSLFHGNWQHVLVNALLFFYAAARLGHLLRPMKVLFLFFACSLGAAFVYVLSQALFSGISASPLVGASGGVMGMLIAQTVIYPDSRMLFLPISGRNMGKGFLVASFLLFLMSPGLKVPFFSEVGEWMAQGFGAEIFKIGHLYHFAGGLLGMALVGHLLPRLVTLEELRRQRAKRELG